MYTKDLDEHQMYTRSLDVNWCAEVHQKHRGTPEILMYTRRLDEHQLIHTRNACVCQVYIRSVDVHQKC